MPIFGLRLDGAIQSCKLTKTANMSIYRCECKSTPSRVASIKELPLQNQQGHRSIWLNGTSPASTNPFVDTDIVDIMLTSFYFVDLTSSVLFSASDPSSTRALWLFADAMFLFVSTKTNLQSNHHQSKSKHQSQSGCGQEWYRF